LIKLDWRKQMAEEKETKVEEAKEETGLVVLTGEIGIGMRMPDGNVVELNNIEPGMAQVLAYLVKSVAEIRKNI
tara:strand:+ start:258 stop:479 length:222 start_codon:yes stop_codon:yes gene_type:complete